MELEDITYQIGQIFHVPPSTLEFPSIITNLIIPFIFFTYLLKNVLLDRIFKKIFPSLVNWGIACVISFLTLIWISAFGYLIAIGSILYFSYKKIGLYIGGTKGVVIGIVIGAVLVILYMSIPAIIDLIMSLIPAY